MSRWYIDDLGILASPLRPNVGLSHEVSHEMSDIRSRGSGCVEQAILQGSMYSVWCLIGVDEVIRADATELDILAAQNAIVEVVRRLHIVGHRW